MVKKLSALFILLFGVFLATNVPAANAAILENAFLSISNPRSGISADHEYQFFTSGTTLGSIRFQYCVAPSSSGTTCNDTGADGSGGSLNYVEADDNSDDTAFWTESWSAAADEHRWNAYRSTADTNADGTWDFDFTSMTNPSISNCTHTTPANNSTGTCYVRIYTYSDSVYANAVDSGTVSITITQPVVVTARVDPTFSLTIAGVAGSNQTRNLTILTNNLTTTVTTVPFGNLQAGTAKFASQVLTVTGNNAGGYTITADLDTNLTGTAYGDDIDGFIGNSATTGDASAWLAPTGSTSGIHTGWLGVGTDDTGVTNRGDNQFFTLGTTGTVIAESDGPASTRVSNVVYGIEVNAYQQSDNYTGTMTLNALPTY